MTTAHLDSREKATASSRKSSNCSDFAGLKSAYVNWIANVEISPTSSNSFVKILHKFFDSQITGYL